MLLTPFSVSAEGGGFFRSYTNFGFCEKFVDALRLKVRVLRLGGIKAFQDGLKIFTGRLFL
jgi:hypothetical protein